MASVPAQLPRRGERPSSSIRSLPQRSLPHGAVAALMSLVFVVVLAAVGDPMVAVMLTLVLAIAPVCMLWGDRTNARHRS